MAKVYNLIAGGLHDKFMRSRAKVQLIGGGYGNGKTAATCIKMLSIAKDYPGCNLLIARSTYPKLNDTIRKEFLSWCPAEWIRRRPTKDDNTVYLTNGSVINFRYVAQRGKDTEQSTSNLLSATYDAIAVDQMEDPEFEHKDFLDLIGRLRGGAEYIGDDPTMPKVGPRFIIITTNPTRNWVFRELVKPMHDFAVGKYNPKLLCDVDNDGKPLMLDGKPVPMMELFEGSTYENVDNVGVDYIKGMMSAYTNKTMRSRYIMGEWGALEGLVYPQFDPTLHMIARETVREYFEQLLSVGYQPTILEAYDHGIRVPACYLLGYVDDESNVIVADGFYVAEQEIRDVADRIDAMRLEWGLEKTKLRAIYADPQLFRRGQEGGKVGTTVASMFADYGISMQRGDNGIRAGINKVGGYLAVNLLHSHPLTGRREAPHLYFSDHLSFIENEISDYYWKTSHNVDDDIPNDRNDHAMDAVKYLITERPRIAAFVGRRTDPPKWTQWHEIEQAEQNRALPRHR